MANNYLDYDGLALYDEKIKQVISGKADSADVPTKTSDLTNDSNFITAAGAPVQSVNGDTGAVTVSVPSASTTTPKMDGTASAGSGTTWAKGDHVHPTDTSRAPLASPTFTGTPKAPTASAGTNTTQIATTAFVATAITNAISGIQGISYEVVQTLPATGEAGVIYLISNSGSGQNIYDEYIWTGTAFEKIGTTDVDLSGYQPKMDAITNTQINGLFA